MEKRGGWGSKMAFILAASGSAIGLGNIWRFPYQTGMNGGAAFVLIYIIAAFTVGITLFLAEMSLGRATKKNPVGAFKDKRPMCRRWSSNHLLSQTITPSIWNRQKHGWL